MASTFELVSKGWVPGIFALIHFAGFLWKFSDFWVLHHRGILADGMCTDQITNDGIHISTIRFSHEGHEYSFEENTAAVSRKISIGSVHRVRYDPTAPGRAVLAPDRSGLHALAWLIASTAFAVWTGIAILGHHDA